MIEIQEFLKPIVYLFFGQIMASYLNKVPALTFFLPHELLLAQVTGNNTGEKIYFMTAWLCENFMALSSLFHGFQLAQYIKIIILSAPYNWTDWNFCFRQIKPFLWRIFKVWHEAMTLLVWE